jgi:hypothetical protein
MLDPHTAGRISAGLVAARMMAVDWAWENRDQVCPYDPDAVSAPVGEGPLCGFHGGPATVLPNADCVGCQGEALADDRD